jgi:hypothetical protein
MVNKSDLKKGDLVYGIPLAEKGNTTAHNLEVIEIYETGGRRHFRCFSLTSTISYPGCPDYGREIVFKEEDLKDLIKLD